MSNTTQDLGNLRGGPEPYEGKMVHLHNPLTGVQVYVAEAKANRLLADGTFQEGPQPQ